MSEHYIPINWTPEQREQFMRDFWAAYHRSVEKTPAKSALLALVAEGRAHPSEHIGWREEQYWLQTGMG